MTTGRINQGASSCVREERNRIARARTRRLDKRHLRATRASARQCRTSGLAQWRTDDTLRARIACQSSIVHAMVRSKVNRAHRWAHFSFRKVPRQYAHLPPPSRGERASSAHDTLRRPYERSDIVGIIVQIQTVSR